jgi:serine/threonine protein kinase
VREFPYDVGILPTTFLFQVQGLWTLHAAGIVHRDLSAENVMINADGHIVLTGLEYASNIKQLHDMQHKDRKLAPGGAKENQAPELLLGWTHDFAVDCWGFGILLHLLLSGVVRFSIIYIFSCLHPNDVHRSSIHSEETTQL